MCLVKCYAQHRQYICFRGRIAVLSRILVFGNSHNARFPSEFLIIVLIGGYVITFFFVQREVYVPAVAL
jgi:hypothetical protein